jgi:Protein of unknown function (DUF1997)
MPVTTLEKNTETQSSIVMNPELEQQDLVLADTKQLQPFCFSYRFTDAMLMGADVKTVAKYLDAHQGWFTRCAHPMTASPLGKNGYRLAIQSNLKSAWSYCPKIVAYIALKPSPFPIILPPVMKSVSMPRCA